MVNDDETEESDFCPSPADMKDWLHREVADAKRACALRIREMTGFVDAYVAGQIAPEEARDRQWRYFHRWGDALPVLSSAGKSDEEIVEAIDRAAEQMRGGYRTIGDINSKYRELFPRSSKPERSNSR